MSPRIRVHGTQAECDATLVVLRRAFTVLSVSTWRQDRGRALGRVYVDVETPAGARPPAHVDATTEDKWPASRRIAADLRTAIATGEYRQGMLLPSERKLAEQYGNARNTVRAAVQLLADEGLVVPEQGRGVFVRIVVPDEAP